jgi:signal transduction histidine kinase
LPARSAEDTVSPGTSVRVDDHGRQRLMHQPLWGVAVLAGLGIAAMAAIARPSACGLCCGLLVVVPWADTLCQLLRRKADELQASRARIVVAADAERHRIERDLHDGAQQRLTSLSVKLLLAAQLAGQSPALAGLLSELGADVQDAARELRSLVHGIYPPLLRDSGLSAALSDAARLSTLPATVQTAPAGRYPADIEAAVYFCCLEAMQNACKHAGQRAAIRVRVREEPGTLSFEVIDDGAGFDARGRGLGAGFCNMADRVGAFGGWLRVHSAPGQGTWVTGAVPV